MIEAWRNLLQQPDADLSYLALLLSLPDEIYLAGQMTVVDVDAIHQAREFVKKNLAAQLQNDFMRLYQQHHIDESGNFTAAAIGRRRLKNTCLSYLITLETEQIYQLAEQQFYGAGNMTDQLAALNAITNSWHPAKARSLDSFYHQWRYEALVIDKWFSLQASCSQK